MIVQRRIVRLIVAAVVFFIGALLLGRVIGPQVLLLNFEYPGFDKIVHVVASLFLVVVAYYVIRFLGFPWSDKAVLMVSAGGALLIGVSEEMLQVFSSQRSIELEDLLSNLIGIISGVIALTVRQRKVLTNTIIAAVITGITMIIVYDSYSSNLDYHKGLMSMRASDYEGAYSYFEQAIEGGQERSGLYNETAWVMLEFLGIDFERALGYTSKALEMNPGSPDIMDTHGWALHKTGRSEEAIGYLLNSYKAKPDGYCIQYHIGAVYFTLGNMNEAEVFLLRQLSLNSKGRYAVASRALLEQIRH